MTAPRVSVGLFVYNGERHLSAVIDSLLGQTMEDFVLDISDNASTDMTEEICRSYAAADARVRYVRHDENHGPTWNANFVAQASPETEYFKWCAHDDVYAPTYLERCVAELDQRRDLVACHCRTRYINERGEELMRSFREQDFGDERPWVRINQILLRAHDFSYSFAVIRRSVLEQIRPFQRVNAGDAVVLTELACYGPFGEVPEHLFANRMHPTRVTAMVSRGRTAVEWAKWYGGSTQFPLWRTLNAHWRGVAAAPLSPLAKIRCYLVLTKWMRSLWPAFGWDVASDTPRVLGERIAASWHKAKRK